MHRVLVGTYRLVNRGWILGRRYYALPVALDAVLQDFSPFTDTVLFGNDGDSICMAARARCLVDRRWLLERGCPAEPHGERFVLFDLRGERRLEDVFNRDSEVYAASAEFTGRIDEAFFSRPLPKCRARSIPNVFERLQPYAESWSAAYAFNPLRADTFPERAGKEDIRDVPFPGPLPGHERFTFIDLFAGIGGFHLAMEELGGRCVFASEWDAAAAETYERNFGIPPAGDITKVDETRIPPHDVLCAGFPCQPFSKAGSQLGFEDETKGTLFFDIERILRHHHTHYIVLENVRNLVTHDHGNTWRTIHAHLRDLGYRLTPEPLIVSPHEFGVPQLRERVVILGMYDPEHVDEPLQVRLPAPMRKTDCSLDDILEPHVEDPTYALSEQEQMELSVWDEFYQGITERVLGFPVWVDWFGRPPEEDMPEWKAAFVRKNNELYRNNRAFIDGWLARHDNLRDFTPTMRKFEWQCGGAVRSVWDAFLQKRPSGLRVKRPNCAPALVAIVQVPIIGRYRRRMTVREAARLQSFDDHFIPCDDRHQAYKQFGNAVNVVVIRECARRLLDHE